MEAQRFAVPGMSDRRSVRAISASVSDVPGVRTVEARLDTGTVRVTGTADPKAVQDAIRRAGYDVAAMPDGLRADGTTDPHTSATEVET